MMTRQKRNNNEGFTLIEVIAVLVILGILAAVAIPKYIDLQDNAELRALEAGVAELNGREALAWGDQKLDPATVTYSDATTFAAVDATNLGDDYSWTAPPTVAGGTLEFGDQTLVLIRDVSDSSKPGKWHE